jgi:hypothetical protein
MPHYTYCENALKPCALSPKTKTLSFPRPVQPPRFWDFEDAGKHRCRSPGTTLYAGGFGGHGWALKRGILGILGISLERA